jgi:hypothetical protein
MALHETADFTVRIKSFGYDIAEVGAHTAALGSGSVAQVVAAFTAWLTRHGWTCTDLPGYGDSPDINARYPDGRQPIVEAKAITQSAA